MVMLSKYSRRKKRGGNSRKEEELFKLKGSVGLRT